MPDATVTPVPTAMPRPEKPLPAMPRARPGLIRAVGLLDLWLGSWSVALAVGYLWLYSENYRAVVGGRKVGLQGTFYAIVVNLLHGAQMLGIDKIPGGALGEASGPAGVSVFSSYRMMNVFLGLSAAYLLSAFAWFALGEGLLRGVRWTRRVQGALGWLGLAAVSVYAVFYLLDGDAPRAGLLAVAASALVPWPMILAARATRERGSAPAGKVRGLGLPAWSMIAGGLAVVALGVQVVMAWGVLLAIRACL